MLKQCIWLAAAALLAAGCSSESSTETAGDKAPQSEAVSAEAKSQASSATAPADEAKKAEAKPSEVMDAGRTGLEGRWIFALYAEPPGQELPVAVPVALLNASATDDQWKVTVVEASEGLRLPPQVESTEIDGEAVHLVLSIGEAQLDFRGRFFDGQVWGNTNVAGEIDPSPARLVPTQAKSLKGIALDESAVQKALATALESSDAIDKVREFVVEHDEHPLALNAYMMLIGSAKREGLDAEAVEAIGRNYIKSASRWGDRVEQQTRANVGYALAMTGYQPDLALKFIEEARDHLTGEMKPLESGLESAEQTARVAQALDRLSNSSGAEQQQALEMLQKMQQDDPFSPKLTIALAEYAEKNGKTDAALEHYARLAALPQMEQMLQHEWAQQGTDKPLPSESLATLWKEKHGDTKGLQGYLDQVYRQTVQAFAGERKQPAGEGARTALLEVFTGVGCPPCTAADMAAGAVNAVYPRTDVIVLQYHQHVPTPDPLTNAASEQRGDYYQIPGTPMVMLNGANLDGVGGFLPHIPGVYTRLQDAVDGVIAESSPVRLNLKAEAKEGELTIAADVAGLEDVSEDLRLRLVLAEDEVAFTGRNGVRFHEMVVRDMPGGANGVMPNAGKLGHSQTIPLGKLKQGLVDYLAAFEAESGAEFPIKPLSLKKLHLVAFVQNDATKEVLGAAAVPVSGTLEYPEVEPAGDAAAKDAGPAAKTSAAGAKTDEPALDLPK